MQSRTPALANHHRLYCNDAPIPCCAYRIAADVSLPLRAIVATHNAHGPVRSLCVNFPYMGRCSDSKLRVNSTDLPLRSPALLLQRQQRGVPARCRRVDRERALGGEAVEIARAAGLRARPRETLAA